MDKPKISYSASGVNYSSLDNFKRLAQENAKKTSSNLNPGRVIEESRGESAFVWEEEDAYRAFVIESLGTKNLIADEMGKVTGKSYYDLLAQDTVAMIVNDLIVVGSKPQVVNAYFSVGRSEWFDNQKRSKDLAEGFAKACNLAGAVWGGGETPSLTGVNMPDTVNLAGSAVGIIKPKGRLVLGDQLAEEDVIVLIESSGIHANGLSLARAIAKGLKNGYSTKLEDETMFGEALLTPTHIYAKLIQNLFEENIEIHYMVNLTGHGWRKLMRANREFSYVINEVPKPQEVFNFIQNHSGNADEEMYATFNMGAGFAVFVSAKDVEKVLETAKENNLKALEAGVVEPGPKRVIIKPKNIIFEGHSLEVR